ncbi:MAG: hypothetical protein R2800_12380 [Flavipsychrobacter sp.]
MRKLSYLLVPAFCALLMASCVKKEDVVPTTPTTPTTNTGPTPQVPTQNNVDGVLAAIKMNFKIEQAGFTIDVVSEVGVASMYSSTGSSTIVDAGTVKLNSNALDKNSNNSYTKTATTGQTPSDLGLSSGASWDVSGAGSVSAFTYNHGSTFPKYTGTMPKSITKSSGLTLTFNSGNVKNADSVYVFIASGSNSFIKGYATNAGSITVTSSELSNLATVSDNTAILEILPVKIDLITKNGKQYAFVKEEANVRYININ